MLEGRVPLTSIEAPSFHVTQALIHGYTDTTLHVNFVKHLQLGASSSHVDGR